jgi:hypothetical protein
MEADIPGRDERAFQAIAPRGKAEPVPFRRRWPQQRFI